MRTVRLRKDGRYRGDWEVLKGELEDYDVGGLPEVKVEVKR